MQDKQLFTKIILTLLVSLFSQQIYAAGVDDFVITVKTNNVGTTANNEFQIPINNGGGGVTFHYNVDCDDDGNFEVIDYSADYTCVYGSAGTYTIRIEDKIGDGSGFTGIAFNNGGDKAKLLTIEQWGTFAWKFLSGAFWSCTNLVINAVDTPNLSGVTDLSNMFRFAFNANPDTTNWDVSNVTTMHSMFRSASSANPDTSNWDTANVTTMVDMFRNATSASPNVLNWDVTSVTDMTRMFNGVTLPRDDYDKLLITFNAQNVQTGVIFDGGNSKYCATGSHDSLENVHNWAVITDGGVDAGCPSATGDDDFVTVWITSNTGVTNSTSIKIPTFGSGYDYAVDWNSDGIFDEAGITGTIIHDFGVAGTYPIRIRGDFPQFKLNYAGDRLKLVNILNWGINPWTSMKNAFAGAENMIIQAFDAPNLSNLTSVQGMFVDAILAEPDTTNWDTSNITDMSGMFSGAIAANPSVQNWDITMVSDMSNMFNGVSLPTNDYDALLIHFNSQSVQSNIPFDGGGSQYCSSAAQLAHENLINMKGWMITDGGLDPSCPETLADDFVFEVDTTILGSTTNTQFEINTTGTGYNYNVDCDGVNAGTNTVTTQTGNYTCNYASPGVYTIRISDNAGDKTGFPRINSLFHDDVEKIVDIKQWGTGKWISMQNAFIHATNMQVTATDIPNLSNVTSLAAMFNSATLANPDVSGWNTTNVTNMSTMFIGATSANPDVSSWNTSNVTSMDYMFSGATVANPDVSNWNTANVTNMRFMFNGATSAIPDISNWNITGLTVPDSMDNMLTGITLSTALYDATLANFDAQITASGIVFDAGNSKYCNIAAHDGLINTHGWTIIDGGLDPNCLGTPTDDFVIEVDTTIAGSTTNTQFEINTTGTGYNYNVDCDGVNAGTNTATAQTGNYTCNYASPGVYTIRISDNVGDKTGFPSIDSYNHNDRKKIIDLIQWGTGKWTSMSSAFYSATNMQVTATDVPDLSNVMYMSLMFNGASSANPDVSLWNTSNVTNMAGMFSGATSANPDVSLWNTSNVTNMALMFDGATSANPDVSNWNTSNVTDMASMFNGATLAIPDMSNWNITGVTVPFSMDNMLIGITLPRTLYDATLANFNAQITTSGIVFDAGNSKYCNVIAHDSLINTHGWTITDGGLDTNCPPAVENIFSNGFEDVIVFKAAQSQFNYDFSEVSIAEMDELPLLIAEGVDAQQNVVIQIYLRNDLGQMQIKLDKLIEIDGENNQWTEGQWQSIDHKELTTISW